MPVEVVAREIANGAWFFVNLSCLVLFIRYTIIHGFLRDVSLRALMRSRSYVIDVQAAIALSVYFFGATLRAAYVWAILKAEDAGWQSFVDWLTSSYVVMYLAAGFAVVGGLCCVRVFSDMNWGPKGWLIAAVLAFAIPIIVHFI